MAILLAEMCDLCPLGYGRRLHLPFFFFDRAELHPVFQPLFLACNRRLSSMAVTAPATFAAAMSNLYTTAVSVAPRSPSGTGAADATGTPAAMLARLVLTKSMPATMKAFLSLLAASSWSGPCPHNTAEGLRDYVLWKLPIVDVAEPASAMQPLVRGLMEDADCACRKAVLAALLDVSCTSGLFATLLKNVGANAHAYHWPWEEVPYLIPAKANEAPPRVWLSRKPVMLNINLRIPGSGIRSAQVYFERSSLSGHAAPVRVHTTGLRDEQSCAVTCCVFEAGDGHAQFYKTLLHSPVAWWIETVAAAPAATRARIYTAAAIGSGETKFRASVGTSGKDTGDGTEEDSPDDGPDRVFLVALGAS